MLKNYRILHILLIFNILGCKSAPLKLQNKHFYKNGNIVRSLFEEINLINEDNTVSKYLLSFLKLFKLNMITL